MFNVDFVKSLKNLLSLLDPIAKLINVCQKSDVSVADSTEEWLNLFTKAPKEMKTLVENRIKKCNVFNDSLAVKYLHPSYRGQKLSTEQRKQVVDYIFEVLDSGGLESYRLFNCDDESFASLKRKDIQSPKTYWYYASEERTQQVGDACNETRNRLLPERSKMLMDIYFTLRSTNKIDEEDYDEEES